MSKKQKRLQKLRQNPKNVSMDDLRVVLEDFGFELINTVGSHHTFSVTVNNQIELLVIPFRRPIKTIYVKKALRLIEKIIQAEQDTSTQHDKEDEFGSENDD